MRFFYEADKTVKAGLASHHPEESIKGLKELIGFIAIMASDRVPGREARLCSEVKKDGHWEDYERIIKAL